MKPIVPLDRLTGAGYPTLTEVAEERRGFLRAALAGAAVVGGTLLGARPAAGRGQAATLVELVLTQVHYFGGCNYSVRKLIVQSTAPKLIAFLRDDQERPELTASVLKVLRAHGCDDVTDRKRLARLESATAAAVLARYVGRQGQRAPLPIVNLVLENRRPVLRGRVRNPNLP